MSITSYGLYRPRVEDCVLAFGSAAEALRRTGGDIPTLCYLIHNPEYRERVNSETSLRGELFAELADLADRDAVAAAWDGQGERKSIAEVMRQTGFGFVKAKRILVELGRVTP